MFIVSLRIKKLNSLMYRTLFYINTQCDSLKQLKRRLKTYFSGYGTTALCDL